MSRQTMRSPTPDSSRSANGRFTRKVNTSEAAVWLSRTERRSSLPGASAASRSRSVGPVESATAGAAPVEAAPGPAVAATAASATVTAAAAAREASGRSTFPGEDADVTNG
jgi:hypothetical protein